MWSVFKPPRLAVLERQTKRPWGDRPMPEEWRDEVNPREQIPKMAGWSRMMTFPNDIYKSIIIKLYKIINDII